MTSFCHCNENFIEQAHAVRFGENNTYSLQGYGKTQNEGKVFKDRGEKKDKELHQHFLIRTSQ